MTFCQSAGNHATVAAGSSVAATEIDSNKCRERKSEKGEGDTKEGGGGEDEGQRGEKGEEEKEGKKRKRGTGRLKLHTRHEW